jgi:hypothetical protein
MPWIIGGAMLGSAGLGVLSSSMDGGKGGEATFLNPNALISGSESYLMNLLMAGYTEYGQVDSATGNKYGETKTIPSNQDPGEGWVRTSKTNIEGPNWEYVYQGTGETPSALSTALDSYINFMGNTLQQQYATQKEGLQKISETSGPAITFGGQPMISSYKPLKQMQTEANLLTGQTQAMEAAGSAYGSVLEALTGVPLQMWQTLETSRYGTPTTQEQYYPSTLEQLLPVLSQATTALTLNDLFSPSQTTQNVESQAAASTLNKNQYLPGTLQNYVGQWSPYSLSY